MGTERLMPREAFTKVQTESPYLLSEYLKKKLS